MELFAISLFSGGGGLDLGVTLALPGVRTVCYVEREAYACSVLAARMEEGSLAPAPVWTDVSSFDGRPWRGLVDLVTGGFPCQDISVAGKGAGLAGERSGLWREYARIVAEVQPRLVFIENVAVLRSRGLDQVLADLAALGFDAEWDCFRASDVGAPHRRERIFILAHTKHTHGRSEAVVHADSSGSQGRGVRGLRGADERTTWPPGPEEFDQWREFLRLRPHLEPAVCRVAHGLAGGLVDRTDRLRLLGNGVVPQVAALAFTSLLRRAEYSPGPPTPGAVT